MCCGKSPELEHCWRQTDDGWEQQAGQAYESAAACFLEAGCTPAAVTALSRRAHAPDCLGLAWAVAAADEATTASSMEGNVDQNALAGRGGSGSGVVTVDDAAASGSEDGDEANDDRAKKERGELIGCRRKGSLKGS
jgi:hypothetical protein